MIDGWVGHQPSRAEAQYSKCERRIIRQMYAATSSIAASLTYRPNQGAAGKQRASSGEDDDQWETATPESRGYTSRKTLAIPCETDAAWPAQRNPKTWGMAHRRLLSDFSLTYIRTGNALIYEASVSFPNSKSYRKVSKAEPFTSVKIRVN
ncbi:MAG: hypothetical protein Q9210_001420 [Variospora velana]